MDYKNLLIRSVVGISFLLIFYIFIFLNKIFIILLFFIIFLIILFEIIFFFNKYKVSMLIYLVLSFASLFYYLIYSFDFSIFIIFILSIVSFDTFGYLIGSSFGKNKITPIISPNKTYEGVLGGYIITLVIFFIFVIYTSLQYSLFLLLFLHLIIIFSFLGDILQSFFKRNSNLKDSSKLIPGHGGFFDRFDSLIFCNYLLLFLNQTLIL